MDEQVELLRGIWNEMKALNGRVDATNVALNDGLGGLRAELHDEIGGLGVKLHDGLDGVRGELHDEIGGLRAELHDGLGGLRAELHDEIGTLGAKLHQAIGGLRSEFKEEFFALRTDLKTEIRRNVDRDLRLGTAVAELSLDVRELTGIVHAWRDEHRLDREDLRERVARLERRIGLDPL